MKTNLNSGERAQGKGRKMDDSGPARISAVRLPASVLGLLASLLLLSSCSFPTPQTDPTRYYLLSTPAANVTPQPPTEAPAVHVRQVELASYIRTRPLVVRKGNNEVEFREYARWGEPLEHGIARVLREELLARGAASAVSISAVRAAGRPFDYELTVRVLACEGMANGDVVFRARWELTPTGDRMAAPVRGDFHAADLHWNGKDEATLAAQLSAAVAGLAGEIAAALGKK